MAALAAVAQQRGAAMIRPMRGGRGQARAMTTFAVNAPRFTSPLFNVPATSVGRFRQPALTDAAANPPLPLDEAAVLDIRTYIEERGGTVSLGKLTTDKPGIKKAQLEPHFYLVMSPGSTQNGRGGNYLVSTDSNAAVAAAQAPPLMPGSIEYGQIVPLVPSVEQPKKKKRKKEHDPNAPPPQPLDTETLASITNFLQSIGGSLSLGKLTSQFEGLKKVQLEPHFVSLPDGRGTGDFVVSISGDVAAGAAPIQLLQQQQALQQMGLAGGQGLAGFSGVSSLSGVAPMEQSVLVPKKKKQKKQRDPDAPPPPPLEQSKVDEIASYLQLQGGVSRLGKLTSDFSGLKKAQLEPHFVVCGDPSVDLTVCLDISTAIANGFQMPG